MQMKIVPALYEMLPINNGNDLSVRQSTVLRNYRNSKRAMSHSDQNINIQQSYCCTVYATNNIGKSRYSVQYRSSEYAKKMMELVHSR